MGSRTEDSFARSSRADDHHSWVREGLRTIAATIVVLAIILAASLGYRQFIQEQRRQSCYARMLVVQQRHPWDKETFGKQLGHCDTGFYST